jgi:Yersinia/Haemophilus virulence surface antigen
MGIVDEAAKQRNGLRLVSLRRPKGGHAVAIQSEPTKSVYRYFDANFGHFRLNSASRFKAWLNQFLMKSGDAARYTSGSVLRLVG